MLRVEAYVKRVEEFRALNTDVRTPSSSSSIITCATCAREMDMRMMC